MAVGDSGDSPPYPMVGGVGKMGVLFPPAAAAAAATRCRCNCCALLLLLWYSIPGLTPEISAAAMEDSEDDELDWLVDVNCCCCDNESPLLWRKLRCCMFTDLDGE